VPGNIGTQNRVDTLIEKELSGAPGEIRTPDLMVRSHALYPTELRARAVKAHIYVGPRAEGGELP
jgi:hypothetical protein